MIGACCTVLVTRTVIIRRGRVVEVCAERFDVAVCEEAPGAPPRLLDTRTGEPWAGELTAEEQAEADAGLERAREMRRLDEQRWPRAA
ncbi:hypothetical protein [Sorangium sp. So ce1024]|uniref:hypothetical protein n=1 Tax=Sorangium sp. So ce1024 TaxID=3133327 RepID=UPI003EFC3684